MSASGGHRGLEVMHMQDDLEVHGSNLGSAKSTFGQEIFLLLSLRELRGCFKQFATKIRWISKEE